MFGVSFFQISFIVWFHERRKKYMFSTFMREIFDEMR